MEKIRLGQMFLILCCLMYLVWWLKSYHPTKGDSHYTGTSGIMLIITSLLGLFGAGFNMSGILNLSPVNGFISGYVVIAAGVITYPVLFVIFQFVLHRETTTELFLIVGWVMLETASVNIAYALGIVSMNAVIIFLILVLAAAISSLYFYLKYFIVAPMKGYIYGAIPLITEAICMGIFNFMTRLT